MNSPKKVDELANLIEFSKESIEKSAIVLIVLCFFYLGIGLLFSSNYLGWFFLVDSIFHLVPGTLAIYAMRKERYHHLKLYKQILLSLILFNIIMIIVLIVTICYVLLYPNKCAKQKIEACKLAEDLNFLVLIACFLGLLISFGSIAIIFSFYRRVDRFLNETPQIKFTPVRVDSNN